MQSPREDNSWKYAGGGMESTALDLARFGDLVRRAKLVSETGRDVMWTRAKLSDGTEIGYGLGWGVAADRSQMSHTGSQQGALASCALAAREVLADRRAGRWPVR